MKKVIFIFLFIIFQASFEAQASSSKVHPKQNFQERSLRNQTCEETEACSICLEKFNQEDSNSRVIVLPCSPQHVFHQECLDKWYDTNDDRTCPVCRKRNPLPTRKRIQRFCSQYGKTILIVGSISTGASAGLAIGFWYLAHFLAYHDIYIYF